MDNQILQQLKYYWAKCISTVFSVAIQFSNLKQPMITGSEKGPCNRLPLLENLWCNYCMLLIYYLNIKDTPKIFDGRLWLRRYTTKKPYAEGNPKLTCFCFKYCENITAEWIFAVVRSNAVTS